MITTSSMAPRGKFAFCGSSPLSSYRLSSSTAATSLRPSRPLPMHVRRKCTASMPLPNNPDTDEPHLPVTPPETLTSSAHNTPSSTETNDRNALSFTNNPLFLGALALLSGVALARSANAAPSDMLSALDSFINGPNFIVSLSLGMSAFVQSVTGFGFAITCVGALTQLPWIANSSMLDVVQPVVATLGALTGWILLLPEIKEVDWKGISALLIATTIATPLGIFGVDYVDSSLVIHGLGALVSAFVVYSVLGVELPKQVGSRAGAYGFGLLAGTLGGAFDMMGPALVIHASAAGWNTNNGEFRRNMLGVITVNSSVVLLLDYFSGRLNDYYYSDFVTYAIPTVLVGIAIGKVAADRLDPKLFKNLVLALCLFMGVRLLTA